MRKYKNIVLSSIVVASFVLLLHLIPNLGNQLLQSYAQDTNITAIEKNSSETTLNDNSTIVAQKISKDDEPKGPFIGVAMKGYWTKTNQGKELNNEPPTNYFDESFKILSEAGLNHVRFLMYWESYVKNPTEFVNEIKQVAEAGDKWNIKILYDNHQWHTSSWFEKIGTGFPSFLFDNNPSVYQKRSGGNTDSESAQQWWTDWWSGKINDSKGNAGWQLQADYLKTIVELVDDHKSTLGYEILSEPQVHSKSQWTQIGKYNSFMVDFLRQYTDKTLVYSMNIPVDLDSNIDVTPENLAKMAPADKTNVAFKISVYGLPDRDQYQKERFNVFLKTSELAEVPLYIGEWNEVVRTKQGGVYKLNAAESDITQDKVNKFLKTFTNEGVYGMAYWKWDYNFNDLPNFNLIEVKNNAVTPTKYFNQLKEGIDTFINK